MPKTYRRKTNRNPKRKQYRKRNYRRGKWPNKPYYNLSNTPLPKQFCTKLKYTDAFSINPAAGTVGEYRFLANDLYQPNAMTTGHQPYGFDQLMAMYDHFCVIGAKIRFRVSVPSNNDQPFIMLIQVNDGAALTQANNVTAVMEQPRTKRKIISKPSNATGNELELTHTFSTKSFFHLKSLIGQSQFQGDAGSRPTEQALFICGIAPMDAVADLAAYTCTAEIVYTAVFTEPRILNQS
ncbi:MAG: hypothetical protein H7836_17250 [Magnetococcus sp. YQC-3]